ncbi:MAG: hypothetical protein GY875_23860 [Gammaproteobacteria bacterium]|nr:hypothetical protein [Gammaproteobacteria bacterium]
MSLRCKPGFVLAVLCLLSACVTVTPPEPVFSYNEVVIINQLRIPVRDVAIQASESGRVFSCGNIAPRGICSNKFPAQPYYGNPIQVSWLLANGRRHDRTIELQLPESFAPEIPLRGVLVIDAQGAMSAYLEQEAPGPHL